MFKRKVISPARKLFRRILLSLAAIALLFAGFMSYYYVGHRNGTLKQEEVAPTVFATDVYLYQTRAYWADNSEKYKIAHKLVKLGLFDRQYYYAGREMMSSLAEDGYEPAAQYVEANFSD